MKKSIVVTGGAQGIGKIISLKLIEKGYKVIVFETDEEAIDEFRQEVSTTDLQLYPCDVSDEQDVKHAIHQVTRHSKSIYGLINNAAVSNNKPIEELTIGEWNRVLGVNLTGSFICSKLLIPILKKEKGAIINLCSTRAFQSEANTEAYSASKGGIYSLTHALAISVGPNVRVNSISPGWIDVSAIRKKSEAVQYRLSNEDHQQHPAGRVGNADDIANMIIFLLKAENSFITGQNFVVDGGMSKKMIYV